MRNKVDIEAIARQIDFEKAISRIKNAAQVPKPKRTYADLLEPLKPYLIEARERKVNFVVLLQCLKESGIIISEPTLRQYLKGAAGKRRRKGVTSRKSPREKKPNPPRAAQLNPSEPTETERKLPPRLARRTL